MKKLVAAAILGGVVALIGAKFVIGTPSGSSPSAFASETAFHRVIDTHTLRCAYAAYNPFIIIEPNGKLKGIFYDVVNEAAKRLGLKVDWAEEVGYGNINTGFMTGRYDAFCAGLWPAGTRAASTIFSRAVVWDPVSIWVRGNDARFDGDIGKLNNPAYKIADMDGDATVAMADALFPKAGRVTMSQNQTIGEEIEQVTTGKADADFRDYFAAYKFMQHDPGSLKDLSPGKPPLIYPLTIGFNQGEFALR
ncbi:MAG: transporter substrate-binding domain-containing protein, partial [Alphaproteobacteria bacterium]|nr:transporter substrate-binding domain-containing protein [Alphaproteobacteria bacterium]